MSFLMASFSLNFRRLVFNYSYSRPTTNLTPAKPYSKAPLIDGSCSLWRA
jgi:hypothetical protein